MRKQNNNKTIRNKTTTVAEAGTQTIVRGGRDIGGRLPTAVRAELTASRYRIVVVYVALMYPSIRLPFERTTTWTRTWRTHHRDLFECHSMYIILLRSTHIRVYMLYLDGLLSALVLAEAGKERVHNTNKNNVLCSKLCTSASSSFRSSLSLYRRHFTSKEHELTFSRTRETCRRNLPGRVGWLPTLLVV